jgi:thioredoxin 1
MTSNTSEYAAGARDKRGPRDAIRTVTGETFKSLVLDGDGPIAVEFMSYGCSFCRALEPVLQQVAPKLATRGEQLFRLNVAAEEELAQRFGITGTPTFVMFLSGAEVGRAEGPHPTASSVLTALTGPFEQ